MKPEHVELVLLCGPDKAIPVQLDSRQPRVDQIVQRERSPEGLILKEHLWICQNDERDLTGQWRIFREMLAPIVEPKGEDPIFQELTIKKPLSFTWES